MKMFTSTLLFVLVTIVKVHTQTPNAQNEGNHPVEFKADKLVQQFAMYAMSNNLTAIAFLDFEVGRKREFRINSNAYSASEVLQDHTVEAKCSDFVPDSYDFLQCDFTHRRALMRKRFAKTAIDDNDCVMQERDVHVHNFSSNALLKHSDINCDCRQGFRADSAQSLAQQNIRVSSNPSSDGKSCVVSLTHAAPAPDSAERKIWYILGCNYQTGMISLLALSKNKSDPFSTRNVETFQSEICGTNYTELPRFYEVGLCNFTTGKRHDKAIYLRYDAKSNTFNSEEVHVQIPQSTCGCDFEVMRKFAFCDYQQAVGQERSYRAKHSEDGNTCEVLPEITWLKKSECNCKNGSRYLAPPQCPILRNNFDVTHSWTMSENGKFCVTANPANSQDSDLAEVHVYDPQLRERLRAKHQELQNYLENLFLEPLQSSCECTTKELRVPVGCLVVRKQELLYFMRFLVLTRRRGSFFCTVSQKYERLRVNPKYCNFGESS